MVLERRVQQKMTTYTSRLPFVSELFRRNGKLKEGKHHFHIKGCPIQIKRNK